MYVNNAQYLHSLNLKLQNVFHIHDEIETPTKWTKKKNHARKIISQY